MIRSKSARALLETLCALLAASTLVPRIAAAQDTAPAPPPPADSTAPSQPPTATPSASPATTEPVKPTEVAAEPPSATATTPATPSGTTSGPKVTIGGYAEAYYSYNFNTPSNGVTNLRWMDSRNNSFALQTAALDVTGELDAFSAHIVLQAGPTAAQSYADSVEARAAAGGAAPLDASTWRILQQATIGWKAPVGRGLLLQAGLFLTPIGYEGIAVKDNYNWSRSNLFFALPLYHAGVKASYELTERLTASAMVVNGWNAATDVNDGKSALAQLTYKIPDLMSASILYMGGPERSQNSAEGRPIRHLFDGWAEFNVHPLASVAVHGNAGFEKNAIGTHSWKSAALYARVKPASFLYIAARGDAFYEDLPTDSAGTPSSAIFYGSDVYSVTGTVDLRPVDRLSFRIEYRHDWAKDPLYFKKGVEQDATTGAYLANAKTQDTVTLGATGWF